MGPSFPPLSPDPSDVNADDDDDDLSAEISSLSSPSSVPSTASSPSHRHLDSHSTPSDHLPSVLDSQFHVRGVKNLRVAGEILLSVYSTLLTSVSLCPVSPLLDASAIPLIPNGNVHSTVVMVASRAADLLIQEYKKENEATSTMPW
jgi:hypothetical protein